MEATDRQSMFVRQHDALRRFVRKIAASDEEAREIVQDVAVILFTHHTGPTDPQSLAFWCRGVARHLAAHRRRSFARRRTHEEDEVAEVVEPATLPLDDPEHVTIARDELAAALLGLKESELALLLDRFVFEETPSEMAVRMNISAASVRMRLMRLLAGLRIANIVSPARNAVAR